MIQSRRCPRFLFESAQAFGIGGECRRKHFDRDLPMQPWIVRAIHLAHAAGAESGHHFVWAEMRAGRESHGKRMRLYGELANRVLAAYPFVIRFYVPISWLHGVSALPEWPSALRR